MQLLRESPFECDSGSRNNDTGDRCSMSGPTDGKVTPFDFHECISDFEDTR